MPDFRHGCVTRRRMAFLSQISVSMLYEKTLCEKVVYGLRFVLKRAVLKQARTRETPGLKGIADTCYTSSMPSLIGSKGIGAPFRQLKTLRPGRYLRDLVSDKDKTGDPFLHQNLECGSARQAEVRFAAVSLLHAALNFTASMSWRSSKRNYSSGACEK